MIVTVDSRKKRISFRGSVLQLMKRLKLSREEYIAKVNGRLAADDEVVGGKDRVELIKVVYGG